MQLFVNQEANACSRQSVAIESTISHKEQASMGVKGRGVFLPSAGEHRASVCLSVPRGGYKFGD